jgi:hypothetical protein
MPMLLLSTQGNQAFCWVMLRIGSLIDKEHSPKGKILGSGLWQYLSAVCLDDPRPSE